MNLSLQTRLLLAASLVLAAFLGLTGVTLDRAFRESAEAGMRERLQAHVYGLLAGAELTASGRLHIPDALPEARFSTPASGLYARVFDGDGRPVWSSGSSLGLDLDLPRRVEAGRRRFVEVALDGVRGIALGFGTVWEAPGGRLLPFTFSVAEDLAGLTAEVTAFRRTLLLWLGGAAVLLLLAQGTILRWGLRPLRRVSRELAAIERGDRERLGDDYPVDLAPLTSGINRFIAQEQARLERHRHALGDLAHSLKTPLAVLRDQLGDGGRKAADGDNPTAQVDRMAEIIEYQLQRAATAGRRPLSAPVRLAPILDRVLASLDKVHRDKGVEARCRIAPDLDYRAEEGDLYEMFGNLLDNAYKWCAGTVALDAERTEIDGARFLCLRIEDDGPGLPDEVAIDLPVRGRRLDSTVPGHGIGLAMVVDLVAAYGGTLATCRGEFGGACIEVRLPE
ncbi:MAG: ATP-binding protein [Gammaproteobacteria bacterium]|nr:ATP-binding protein [Gammaproteobacteria bacterium]